MSIFDKIFNKISKTEYDKLLKENTKLSNDYNSLLNKFSELKEDYYNTLDELAEITNTDTKTNSNSNINTKPKQKYNNFGEYKLSTVVNTLIDNNDNYNDFHLINNVTLKTNNVNISSKREIDHLLISPYGIVIIENKHWNGFNYLLNKNDFKYTQHNPNSFAINKSNGVKYFALNAKYKYNKQYSSSDYSQYQERYFSSFLFDKQYENYPVVNSHLKELNLLRKNNIRVAIAFTANYNTDNNKLFHDSIHITKPFNLKVTQISNHYIYTLEHIEELLKSECKRPVIYSRQEVQKLVNYFSYN